MTTQDFYNEIYEKMIFSKEKGYKIVLKKDLQSILLVNIKVKDDFIDHYKKIDFIYLTSLSVDNLVTNIISKEGNKAKIKLRDFFYRSNKILW